MPVQWFNGTHIVRVVEDASRKLGIRVEMCEGDSDGKETGKWATFIPSQEAHYREWVEVLAEGMRHLV